MPLFKQLNPSSNTAIALWQITESEEQLLEGIDLRSEEKARLLQQKSIEKRQEFLAVRQTLKSIMGKSPRVDYNIDGKPFLQDHIQVSFSHTKGFAGVILSEKHLVGIDLELHREQIERISHKFMRHPEKESLHPQNPIGHLTHYWGAKECLVKITGNKKLDFKEQLHVKPFEFKHPQQTTASILWKNESQEANLYFDFVDPLYLTYGWQKID